MIYKVTYDLVAISASEYIIPNSGKSKFIHPLAYKLIPTSTNYYYKYSFPLEHTLERPLNLYCLASNHGTVSSWCLYPPNHHLHQRRFRRIYLSTNPSPHDPQNLLLAQTNRPMKTPGRIFSIIPSCQSD